jgi:mannosyltransferase OCH1-like enzyme
MSSGENISLEEYTEKYLLDKLKIDNSYTYEKAKNDVIQKLYEKGEQKILEFNKNIKYSYDFNGIPKIIHLTCKDKRNIDNSIWKSCLEAYQSMYSDYTIIIYDDNDIFNIISTFDKKSVGLIKSIKKGAIIADIFRYLILYLRGGYYSDFDCFPNKRIEKLSELQYHGDNNNNIHIIPFNSNLHNKEYEFYRNPCNNFSMDRKINGKNPKLLVKCKGHQYINHETNIIVCYEFEKTWHNELMGSEKKDLWIDNNIGICQWFIGAKQKQKLFLECYKKSLKNVKKINFENKDNYHFNVINSTGPLFFTKVINKYINKYPEFKKEICILPSDFFCSGSGFGSSFVPSTKNMYVQHKFTGSWLK